MADTNTNEALQKLLEALEKARLAKQTNEEDPTYIPQKQVEGYKERIEGSGLDAEKEADQRNWLEKALNLTPDQNALFDIFEVINRPQQAVFGAVNAAQEGESAWKGAKEGIKGERDTRFKDILNDAGIGENDKFGVDSIIGFAGDVFLDPVDLALFAAAPFTGGASGALAFAEKATKRVSDVQNLIKEADAVGDIAKSLKLTKRLTKLAETADDASTLANAASVLEGAKKLGDAGAIKEAKLAYQTALKPLKVRKSTLQMAMRGAKDGALNSFALADTGISKVLSKLDDMTIANNPDFYEAASKTKYSDAYKNAKSLFKNTFDMFKAIPKEIVDSVKKYGGRKDMTTFMLKEKYSNFLNTKLGADNLDTMINDLNKLRETDNVFGAVTKSFTKENIQSQISLAYEMGGYKVLRDGTEVAGGLKRNSSIGDMVRNAGTTGQNMGFSKKEAQMIEEYLAKTFP